MRYFRIPLFILVFFIIDAGLGLYLRPHFHAIAFPDFRDFYSRYIDSPASFDVVFFGDSRILHGINTGYYSELCDCNAGNLAVGGSTMVSTYYLLRDYLAYSTPRQVVLGVQWSRLGYQREGYQNALLLEMLPERDQIDYALAGADLNFIAEKLLYSYRYRQAFPRVDLYIQRIFGKQDSGTSTPTHMRTADQFVPVKDVIDPETDIQLATFQLLRPFDRAADPTQLAYLEKTLLMLREKNIPVVMVQQPELHEVQQWITHLDELNAVIVEIAETHNVTYINLNDSSDPALKEKEYFYDIMHLNAAGADLFTKKLWDRITASAR